MAEPPGPTGGLKPTIMMIPLTLKQACSPEQLYQGWLRIKRNRGQQGIESFSSPWNVENELNSLSHQIIQGYYQPQPLLFVPMVTQGKERNLSLPSIRDSIVQSAISLQLTPLIDPMFEDCSFAYRPGRSIQMAQHAVVQTIQSGRPYIIRTDISDCFDTIPFPFVNKLISILLTDSRLIDLILRFISAPLIQANRLYPRQCGIPQGSPLSPLLCNVVLDAYDKAMIDAGFSHVRYADDLVLLGEDARKVHEALAHSQKILHAIGLEVNWDKTYLSSWNQGFQFLGGIIRKGEL